MGELLGELAVICQEQQAGTVFVEASYGVELPVFGRQEVVYGAAALPVSAAYVAYGFVEHDSGHRYSWLQNIAIQGYCIGLYDLHTLFCGAVVYLYASGTDGSVGGAPTERTGAGHVLINSHDSIVPPRLCYLELEGDTVGVDCGFFRCIDLRNNRSRHGISTLFGVFCCQ